MGQGTRSARTSRAPPRSGNGIELRPGIGETLGLRDGGSQLEEKLAGVCEWTQSCGMLRMLDPVDAYGGSLHVDEDLIRPSDKLEHRSWRADIVQTRFWA